MRTMRVSSKEKFTRTIFKIVFSELLLLLATCHTINIEMKAKERNYSVLIFSLIVLLLCA